VTVAVSRADLVRLFGGENLVTVEPAALSGLGLDPEASRILTGIGLPTAAARGLPSEVVPLLTVTPPEPVERPGTGIRYVRIGRLLGDAADAYVDPRTGAVVAVTLDERGAETEVFVNSDLARFVETLYLVNEMGVEQVDADEEEYLTAADDLHERIAALDPPAMADDGWWAAVVQEMQLGMM
jgi:hypothetical protein